MMGYCAGSWTSTVNRYWLAQGPIWIGEIGLKGRSLSQFSLLVQSDARGTGTKFATRLPNRIKEGSVHQVVCRYGIAARSRA